MAVDSATKRASAIHISQPWRSIYPVPDATIDAADRAHAAYLYSKPGQGAPSPGASTIMGRKLKLRLTLGMGM